MKDFALEVAFTHIGELLELVEPGQSLAGHWPASGIAAQRRDTMSEQCGTTVAVRARMRSLVPPALLSIALIGCTTPEDDTGPELDSRSSAVIGTSNAWFLNLGGRLGSVSNQAWGRDWTHVVSTRAADGTPILFFYSRTQHTAKIYRYDTDGTLHLAGAFSGLQDWDAVVASRGIDHNLLFYRRTDNVLKGFDARSTGGFYQIFAQTLDNPGALNQETGWDSVVPMRMSLNGDLLLYHQLSGSASFFRYNLLLKRYERSFDYSGWKKYWDEIESGDFNGDHVDDLVLYNQDRGTLKLVTFDGSYGITSQSILADAGTSAGARLAVGDFGGSSRSDVLLYQVDGGSAFENGRMRVWTDNADGSRSLTTDSTSMNDGWTHVVPAELGGLKRGVLFYSNQHVVKLQVIPVRKESNSAWGSFGWPTDTSDTLDEQLRGMRKTYAMAGLAFEASLGSLADSDVLGTWKCGAGGDRDAANAWIKNNVPSDVLPIIVPLDAPSGGSAGCSNRNVDFVRSSYSATTGVYDSGTDYDYYTEKHFSHELGHYFGLPHSHLEGKKTKADVASMLTAGSDISDLDRDDTVGTPNSDFLSVYDTPPALDVAYFQSSYPQFQAAMCDEGASEVFTNAGSTVSLMIHPYNVMAYNQCPSSLSYGGKSAGMARLTRDQIRVVRETLRDFRSGLVAP